jgi:hypothetical protein
VGGRSAETQFKKGHISPNLKPIGHERICSKDGITLIKVAEPNPYTGSATRYRPKHHVVWEAANGPIPKGMVVRFVDGDKANVNLDNLEMVTKKLNLQLNRTGYSQLPAELKPVAKTACQIQVKIFERDKQL